MIHAGGLATIDVRNHTVKRPNLCRGAVFLPRAPRTQNPFNGEKAVPLNWFPHNFALTPVRNRNRNFILHTEHSPDVPLSGIRQLGCGLVRSLFIRTRHGGVEGNANRQSSVTSGSSVVKRTSIAAGIKPGPCRGVISREGWGGLIQLGGHKATPRERMRRSPILPSAGAGAASFGGR